MKSRLTHSVALHIQYWLTRWMTPVVLRIAGTENVRLKQEFRIQYLKKVHIYQQDLKSPDSLIHI